MPNPSRHQLTVEGLLDPVALIDEQGRVLACNQPWKDLLPRRNLLRLLAAEPSRRPFAKLLKEVLAGSKSECRLQFGWDVKLWFHGKARHLDQPGSAGRATVCLEDISERLNQKEPDGGFFRLLTEQVHDPIFVLDPLTQETVYCNAATLRHLELGSDKLPHARDYGKLFESDHLPKLVERLAVGGPLIVESFHRTARGRRVPIEFSLLLMTFQQSKPMIAGVIRDISQRKQNLADLQLAGSRLEAILESSPLAIITLTLEGFVSSWNRAAERIYGWTAQETLLQSSPFPSDRRLLDLTGQVLEDRGARTVLTQRPCKDGSEIRLNLSLCPLVNASGHITGLLEVAEDVTERSHAELIESNRRLLEARQDERLHLARELHDGVLQDLIAIGFGLAEASRQCSEKSGQFTQVATIQEQQKRVLAVARLLRGVVSELRPAGLQELGLVPSLEALVAKLVPHNRKSPRVHLELQMISELSPTQRLCLFRSAQEALHNALKHGHASALTMTLRREGSDAEFVVRDDGRGFEVPENLSGLTLDNHFGLAGMAERAELTGSFLSIQSAPGQGTEVRLTMPLG